MPIIAPSQQNTGAQQQPGIPTAGPIPFAQTPQGQQYLNDLQNIQQMNPNLTPDQLAQAQQLGQQKYQALESAYNQQNGGNAPIYANSATFGPNGAIATPQINTLNYNPSIQGASQNIGQLYGQQQGLAQQLQQQAAGGGPNPALSQLQATTQQNVAQSNAGIEGARGLNPGLAAQLASSNAAGANQSAANAAATLRAQQQLSAQQQLAGVYGQAGQQQLGQLQNATGANAAQNTAINQGVLGAQGISATAGQAGAAQNAGTVGAILSGVGALGGGIAGGLIGGPAGALAGGSIGSHLAHGGKVDYKSGGGVDGHAAVAGDSPKNDTVPAMLSPGEIVIPRSKASDLHKATEFVQHLLHHEKSAKGETSYTDVLKSKKKLAEAKKRAS